MNRIAAIVAPVILFVAHGAGQRISTVVEPAVKPLSSSPNTQINVMAPPYNAKGDCVTDDSAAVIAAQEAAIAAGWAALFFPSPPGGCYLMSINWAGTSLLGGVPNGTAETNAAVKLKGLPGKDVLHVQDPTTVLNYQWNKNWSIENIRFQVDNSVVSNTSQHRWPGRWFDDAAMSAGSATFTSSKGNVTCADVGQAIQVNGAGLRGANLVSVIDSVYPCFGGNGNWTRVTLANAASITVTNAHAYISVLNLPVTSTVGNCAIGFDDYDGNPSSWAYTNYHNIANYADTLRNVAFTSLKVQTNNVCGIYTQGAWGPYALDVQNFTFRQLVFGVVQGTSELNSWYQSSSNDFQKWNHGSMESVTNPWVSYNGGYGKLEDIELTTRNGPVLLGLGNRWYDGNNGITINVTEHENENGIGWRVAGSQITFERNSFGSATAIIATASATCNECLSAGNIELDGSSNKFDFAQDLSTAKVVNGGLNNKITYRYASNPIHGLPPNYSSSAFPTKRFDTIGLLGPDYVSDGNYATPYNRDDLVFWPQDFNENTNGQPWSNFVVADSASPTRYYLNVHTGFAMTGWSQYKGGSPQVGKDIPASKIEFSMLAKCDAGVTTFTFTAGTMNDRHGYDLFYRHQFTGCSTDYRPFSTTVDFTSHAGGNVIFGTSDNPFHAAWVAITPWKNSNFHTLETDDVRSMPVLYSQLSTCGSPGAPSGTYRNISDPSTKPSYWAPAMGTGKPGPISAPVYCDGDTWRYH